MIHCMYVGMSVRMFDKNERLNRFEQILFYGNSHVRYGHGILKGSLI